MERVLKIIKIVLKKRNKRIAMAYALLIFLLGSQFIKNNDELETLTPPPKIEEITFSKCVDGDTAYLNINGKEEKVRLLAIDTPETVKPGTPEEAFGKEASDYTCKSLMSATNIILEYEEANKLDKYNRVLAWVWVDNELLQNKLIAKGLAKVAYIYGDYKYTSLLEKSEKISKVKKIGVWK